MTKTGGAVTTVLGSGSWGTALAYHLGRSGTTVRLWGRDAAAAARLERERVNERYHPGVSLPECVTVTGDLARALAGASRVLLTIPSQRCREVLKEASAHIDRSAVMIVASKGIENESLALLSDVCIEETGERPVAVLSGPSFAAEVVRGDPTAVVISSRDAGLAETLQGEISHGGLRLYTNHDVLGVQLAGALKNVFAVAAGVVGGLGFGSNSVAALVTRSIAEMSRLGMAMGGRRETFEGLAGLGDLVLTCTGALSRNRRLGEAVGRGRAVRQTLEDLGQVAEGYRTSLSARDLAKRHGLEMPIIEQVHAVLHEGRDPREAIASLLARRLRSEEDE